MNIQTAFGKKLREIRQEKGISQEDLAERAGLHRTYISSVERGERNVTLTTILKIAKAMGVEMAALLPKIEGKKDTP